jgi:serine/threonine protein kinase
LNGIQIGKFPMGDLFSDSPCQYTNQLKLGCSTRNSLVYQAIEKSSGDEVVVKICKSDSQAKRELEALTVLKHNYIMPIKRFHKLAGHFVIVYDYAAGGDLSSFTRTYTHSDEDLQYIMYNLLAGLSSIHSQGFFHGDIKPENLLLRAKDQILWGTTMITDFGMAHAAGSYTGNEIGTTFYLAPEAFVGRFDAKK